MSLQFNVLLAKMTLYSKGSLYILKKKRYLSDHDDKITQRRAKKLALFIDSYAKV